MSTTQAQSQPPALLRISPQTFQFTASKVSSGLVSKLKIRNLLPTHVGYKFKTNAPLRYSVKPVLGVLAPGQSIEVFVRCESWVNPQDRFLLQSVALTEDESQVIDAATWKELDRRRFIENFIQCSSSSTLAMREPQDDGGSLSSSSNGSSASSRISSTPSSAMSEKSRSQRSLPQHSHSTSHAQRSLAEKRPSFSQDPSGRKMSTSSTCSTTSSPGSYPTLFTSKSMAGPGRATNSSATRKMSLSAVRVPLPMPLAFLSGPVHYLTNKVSNSKQTLRTVSKFLAIRQYTKVQVLTVSLACLMLGLLLPLEKLFVMIGGGHGRIPAGGAGIVGGHKELFSGSSSTPSRALPIVITPVGKNQERSRTRAQQQQPRIVVDSFERESSVFEPDQPAVIVEGSI